MPNFDLQSHFDEIRQYSGPQHALLIAQEYSPLAYHVSSWLGDETTALFVTEKPGKVVFEMYDVAEGMMRGPVVRPTELNFSAYCIEHADGVCCRDLRSRYLFNVLNYKRPGPVLHFGDFCTNVEPIVPVAQRRRDGIHLVSWGYVGSSKNYDGDWQLAELMKGLEHSQTHIHMYPHPSQMGAPESLEDFYQLEKDCPNFSLSPARLAEHHARDALALSCGAFDHASACSRTTVRNV